MNLINISYENKHKIDYAENVDISNINSIPNYSASNINIELLNYFSKKDSTSIFNKLCEKLKQEGMLTLKLLDLNQLIHYFVQEEITSDDFCKHMVAVQCILSRPEVLSLCHNNPQIKIVDITYDNIYNIYKIQRIEL